MQDKADQWTKIRSEEGPDLKLFKARYDHMKNPRNGQTEKMIILEANDSVNVVAVTPQQDMIFVRQYRFGIEDYTMELPGGIVDPGEDPNTAASRELREETGYTAEHWRPLGKIASNPVFMDSWIHHWEAQQIEFTHEPELDDGEAVEVYFIPLSEVEKMLKEGFFQHPHTVNALLCYFNRS